MDLNRSNKPYDLAIYGATGFTGRQTAEKLWKAAQTYGLKLTLAGRNLEKLETLRSSLGPKAEALVGIHVAESSDAEALKSLAESTRVLVNTAGPFAQFGPGVVQACVDASTDYIDITGETPFVSKIIDLHDEAAREKKVRIIPFCGFDSVPSDLGFWFALKSWNERDTQGRCSSITTLFEARGGFNGGTIASALGMAQDGTLKEATEDLTLLCPKNGARPPSPSDWVGPKKIEELDAWGVPFFMSPINTRVVRRSQSLFGSDTLAPSGADWIQIAYEEGLLLRGPLAPWIGRVIGKIQTSFSNFVPNNSLFSVIRSFLPKPGEGPSERQMENGFMRVTTVARGNQGPAQITRVSSKGDPGNRITVSILTESALCLVLEREQLPERFGVLTPAYAFEGVLLERLRNQGFKFEVLPLFEQSSPRLA